MEQSAGSAGIGRGHQGLARGRGEHFPLARASRLGRSCTPRTPHRPLLDLQWEQPPHQRASLRADWVWLGFTWLGSEQTTLRHWVAGFPDRDLCYQLPPKVIWSLRNWLHRTEFWILNSFIFSQLKMTQCPDNALRIDNWCMMACQCELTVARNHQLFTTPHCVLSYHSFPYDSIENVSRYRIYIRTISLEFAKQPSSCVIEF